MFISVFPGERFQLSELPVKGMPSEATIALTYLVNPHHIAVHVVLSEGLSYYLSGISL